MKLLSLYKVSIGGAAWVRGHAPVNCGCPRCVSRKEDEDDHSIWSIYYVSIGVYTSWNNNIELVFCYGLWTRRLDDP